MNKTYESLAERALHILQSNGKHRIIIAIAGVPGSGKTTLAGKVSNILNRGSSFPICQVLPMDGFHLTRAQLDQMSDPVEAHERRGAPFTFDADGLVQLVQKLHNSTSEQNPQRTILAPSFDHKLKDPVYDDIAIQPHVRIILLEGLYLLLNDEPWNQIAPICDDRWYIEVDAEIARRRVARRHWESGITSNLEDGLIRADGNDAINGRHIAANLSNPDVFIQSIEECESGLLVDKHIFVDGLTSSNSTSVMTGVL